MPPFKYLPDYHAPDAMTDDEASDHSTQADELPAMTQTPMSAQKFTIGSHSAVQIIKYFRLNTISDENALKVECSYWVRRKFIKHGRQPFYDVAQLDTLTDELVKHLTSTFRGQPAFGAVFKELQDRPRGAKDAIQGLMRVLATELPKTRPQQPRPASEGVAKEGKLQGKSNEETQGSKESLSNAPTGTKRPLSAIDSDYNLRNTKRVAYDDLQNGRPSVRPRQKDSPSSTSNTSTRTASAPAASSATPVPSALPHHEQCNLSVEFAGTIYNVQPLTMQERFIRLVAYLEKEREIRQRVVDSSGEKANGARALLEANNTSIGLILSEDHMDTSYSMSKGR